MVDEVIAVITLTMNVSPSNVRDASCQTQAQENHDEAVKQDILESFAMELFLTSVMPRRDAAINAPC